MQENSCDIAKFMGEVGYKFKDEAYAWTALTHTSYANEQKMNKQHNERLEFLGDSILSLVVSTYIFKNFKDMPEGDLSKVRASIVCEKSLASFARKIKLGEYLLIGKGELMSGGRERDSILSDAFEALIAAIYLDGGISPVETFLHPFIVPYAKAGGNTKAFKDYKTELQEIAQKNNERFSYNLVESTGPDHDKTFVVELLLNSNRFTMGKGRSKKEAEQEAARLALAMMGIGIDD